MRMKTNTQKFIEKAVQGGWRESIEIDKVIVFPPKSPGNPDFNLSLQIGLHHADAEWRMSITDVLLDPLAWQAISNVEGWRETAKSEFIRPVWQMRMHRFLDLLIEGKTPEEALGEILA